VTTPKCLTCGKRCREPYDDFCSLKCVDEYDARMDVNNPEAESPDGPWAVEAKP
jgi:hypothetical protein